MHWCKVATWDEIFMTSEITCACSGVVAKAASKLERTAKLMSSFMGDRMLIPTVRCKLVFRLIALGATT